MRVPFLSRLLEIKEWQMTMEQFKIKQIQDILKELKRTRN